MKFKIENTKEPMLGDTRTIRKFAWFPVCCEDYVVWLESYLSVQQYQRSDELCYDGYSYYRWNEIDRREISWPGK